MSIIARLLSKKPETKRSQASVSPNIEKLVKSHNMKKAVWLRYAAIGMGVLIIVIAGLIVLNYFNAEFLAHHKSSVTESTRVKVQEQYRGITEVNTQGISQGEKEREIKVESSAISSPLTLTISESEVKSEEDFGGHEIAIKTKPLKRKVRKVEIADGKMAEHDKAKVKAEGEGDTRLTLTTEQEAERDMYIYQAKAYEDKGDLLAATEYYKKAITIDPNNYRLYNKVSSICAVLKDSKCIIEHAEQALNLKSDYIPALVNLGIGFVVSGRDVDAEEVFLRAQRLSPLNKDMLLNMGILYEKKGELEKAFEYYKRLVELNESSGLPGMARILEKLRRFEEATNIYNEILARSDFTPSLKRFAIERLKMLTTELQKQP